MAIWTYLDLNLVVYIVGHGRLGFNMGCLCTVEEVLIMARLGYSKDRQGLFGVEVLDRS